jgi:subtilase family serine protease
MNIATAFLRLHQTSLALAVTVACGTGALDANAATTDATAYATVAHSTSLRQGDALLGTLPMTQPIHIEVALKMRDRDGLDAFIVNNAKNQAKGLAAQSMTPAQFLASHAPTQAQAQAVANYLRRMGYTNVIIAPNRLLVSADGTARTARDAFMTTFAQVRTRDGRIAFANTTDVRIPATLSDKVLAVVGLQTVHQARTFAQSLPANDGAHTLIVQGHFPTEFPSIYGPAAGYSVSIGIVTDGDLNPTLTDLDVFASNSGTGQPTVKVVNTNGTSHDTSHTAEWDVDSQSIVGMTSMTGSVQNLVFYNVPDLSDANLTADFNAVVAANSVKLIEAAVGECETDAQSDGAATAQDAIFQAAVAQGQTFVVAAGNEGADECGNDMTTPSWPAASRYVVAVGGTNLTGGTNQWTNETAWTLGGGSPSTFEPMPSWQASFGVPGTKRGVPDVAFDGNPASGALVYVNLALSKIGGTGLSAALFAGVWARVISTYGPDLGFAGQILYGLPAQDFHDITSGNNGEPAGVGYDFASGRGSMIISNAVTDTAPPVANFIVGGSGLTGHFTDASTDNHGTIVAHVWRFGDGATSQATSPSHTYATNGTYSVTETVTDNRGVSGASSQNFIAGAAQLARNPSFETGNFQSWATAPSGAFGLFVDGNPADAYDGTYSVSMTPNTSLKLSQVVDLPSYKTSATLVFHLWVDGPVDQLSVEVARNGQKLATLATFTSLDSSTHYVAHSYDLTPYIGQSIAIRFFAQGGGTFRIDDVKVNVH